MNILKTAAAAAAALLLLAGCQAPPQDSAADVAAIKSGSEAWMAAYNAGNADAIAEIYTADAVVMAPNRPAVKGHDAIREMVAADIEGAKGAGITLAITTNDAGASGKLGWDSGSWTATDASGATVDTGHYIAMWRKTENGWRISHDMWNSDRPMPEPPAAAETPAG